jgi:hypothetical protein
VAEYLTRNEEKTIKDILDRLAPKFGLHSLQKESYFREMRYYLDRLWYFLLDKEEIPEKIPVVAFEIERGVPHNERIRKDILNIVLTRAPKGYIIVPHERILSKAGTASHVCAETWYRDHFQQVFETYRSPYVFYCDIRVVDADILKSSDSLRESVVC